MWKIKLWKPNLTRSQIEYGENDCYLQHGGDNWFPGMAPASFVGLSMAIIIPDSWSDCSTDIIQRLSYMSLTCSYDLLNSLKIYYTAPGQSHFPMVILHMAGVNILHSIVLHKNLFSPESTYCVICIYWHSTSISIDNYHLQSTQYSVCNCDFFS